MRCQFRPADDLEVVVGRGWSDLQGARLQLAVLIDEVRADCRASGASASSSMVLTYVGMLELELSSSTPRTAVMMMVSEALGRLQPRLGQHRLAQSAGELAHLLRAYVSDATSPVVSPRDEVRRSATYADEASGRNDA